MGEGSLLIARLLARMKNVLVATCDCDVLWKRVDVDKELLRSSSRRANARYDWERVCKDSECICVSVVGMDIGTFRSKLVCKVNTNLQNYKASSTVDARRKLTAAQQRSTAKSATMGRMFDRRRKENRSFTPVPDSTGLDNGEAGCNFVWVS